jgi:hypothetical protein
MKNMKRILSIFLLATAFFFISIPAGNSKIKPYYSGDAVYYQGKIIIASANSDSLELFAVNQGAMTRLIKFKPIDNLGQQLDVSSVKLNEEDGRLYVYLTAQYTLYKYDVSDPVYPSLKAEIKNNFWEWYNRVETINDKVVTISGKSVKILNAGLQNINAYALENNNAYNVRLEDTEHFILNNSNNYLQVYDRDTRTTISSIPINYKSGNQEGNHKVYGDALKDELFVVDDYFVKKFDFNGNLKASFKHLDQPGYDVEASSDGRFIYFSNGIGIVKLTRSDLKLSAYKFTSTLGGPNGWAMGLKVVNAPAGDNLVIFNNGNILVLNDKLNKIAAYCLTEEEDFTTVKENLFLNLDQNYAAAGAEVFLSGGGFSAQERLTVAFGNSPRLETTADNNGRFVQKVTVPSLLGKTDIKVTGQSSKLSYSIGFEVK